MPAHSPSGTCPRERSLAAGAQAVNVSAPAHTLCPSCRSRVLPNWDACKFCGESLHDVAGSWQPDSERAAPADTGQPGSARGTALPPTPGEPSAAYDPLPPLPGRAVPPPPGQADPGPSSAPAAYNPLPPIPGLPPPPPPFEAYGAIGSAEGPDTGLGAGTAPPPPSEPFAPVTAVSATDWDAPSSLPPVSTWAPPNTSAPEISGALPPGPLRIRPSGRRACPRCGQVRAGAVASPVAMPLPAPPPPVASVDEAAPPPPPPVEDAPLPPPPPPLPDTSSS